MPTAQKRTDQSEGANSLLELSLPTVVVLGQSRRVPMKRSGSADLPLQGGRAPDWQAQRMMLLGKAIAEHIVVSYGLSGFLSG